MTKKKVNKLIPLAGYIAANVPIESSNKPVNNFFDYPDEGVRFAGYAKTLKGNSYVLLKQERYQLFERVVFASGSGSHYFNTNKPDNKNIYISSIIVTATRSAGNNYFTVGQRTSKPNITYFFVEVGDVTTINITFQVPIKIDDTEYFCSRFFGDDAITDFVLINLFGWTEDIP